jgi:hypothetical protein
MHILGYTMENGNNILTYNLNFSIYTEQMVLSSEYDILQITLKTNILDNFVRAQEDLDALVEENPSHLKGNLLEILTEHSILRFYFGDEHLIIELVSVKHDEFGLAKIENIAKISSRVEV